MRAQCERQRAVLRSSPGARPGAALVWSCPLHYFSCCLRRPPTTLRESMSQPLRSLCVRPHSVLESWLRTRWLKESSDGKYTGTWGCMLRKMNLLRNMGLRQERGAASYPVTIIKGSVSPSPPSRQALRAAGGVRGRTQSAGLGPGPRLTTGTELWGQT